MIVTLIVVLFVLILGMGRHIKVMADKLELLDREQHTQNKDLLVLHKCRNELTNMMLQHNEVLTYLAEQDEKLKRYASFPFTIVGEA